tara:strand:+ start:640 stop:1101 length:462 start_codon:yes stop_codon:yes gene_type:complete
MFKLMDTSSNTQVIEIELTENITNINNLDDFIHDLINSITQNINNLSGGNNNQSSFTIEYEIINSDEQTNNTNEKKEITNKDIHTHLGSYKRINIDDDLIKHKSSCPICLEEFKVGEYKRCLSCNHTYHKKCIDKWIKKCNTCPECRKECICI